MKKQRKIKRGRGKFERCYTNHMNFSEKRDEYKEREIEGEEVRDQRIKVGEGEEVRNGTMQH